MINMDQNKNEIENKKDFCILTFPTIILFVLKIIYYKSINIQLNMY